MTAVFDTVLVEKGRIRLLDRHVARFAAAGVPADLVREMEDAARRIAGEHEDASIVVRFDFDGSGIAISTRAPKAAVPVVLIPVPGYEPSRGDRGQKRAARTWVDEADAAVRERIGEMRLDAPVEPLLVSEAGLVGETTRANLFALLADGTIATPRVRGLLPGVTRSWALEQTGATERELRLDELLDAPAAFLTTAGRGIVPVAAVGPRRLGSDERVAKLAADWRAL